MFPYSFLFSRLSHGSAAIIEKAALLLAKHLEYFVASSPTSSITLSSSFLPSLASSATKTALLPSTPGTGVAGVGAEVEQLVSDLGVLLSQPHPGHTDSVLGLLSQLDQVRALHRLCVSSLPHALVFPLDVWWQVCALLDCTATEAPAAWVVQHP